jgi:hypothetical protein
VKLDRLSRIAALAALILLGLPSVALAQDTGSVDVFFLFDAAGSMADGDMQDAVDSANRILDGVGDIGSVAYGVGTYVDFPVLPYGSPGVDDLFFPTDPDSPFTVVQDFSVSSGDTMDALNTLPSSLGFGADEPGSQLYALDQLTTSVAWRQNSTKIIIWFGDTPGHDGDLDPNYPSDVGLDDVIAALGAESIIVDAFELGTSSLDGTGQATAITDATGGNFFGDGINENNEGIVIAQIEAAAASAPVPEPNAVTLFGLGALLVTGALRRRAG